MRLSTPGANRLESSALIRRGLSRMHTIADSVGGTPTLSVPERIILSEGWARRAVAFCAGACGALALEPIAFGPAMAIVCMRERPRRISADNSNRFAPGVDSRVRAGALSAPGVAGVQIPRDNLAGKIGGKNWIVRVYCVAGRAVIVSGACVTDLARGGRLRV